MQAAESAARVARVLRSGDPAAIEQAIELARSLGDSEVFTLLLEGVREEEVEGTPKWDQFARPSHDVPWLAGSRFTRFVVRSEDQKVSRNWAKLVHHPTYLALRLIAAAPEGCEKATKWKASTTSLSLVLSSGRDYDPIFAAFSGLRRLFVNVLDGELRAVPGLQRASAEKLYLIPGRGCRSRSLADLGDRLTLLWTDARIDDWSVAPPGLRELGVVVDSLPSFGSWCAKLERLSLARREGLGAELKTREIEALLARCPNLFALRLIGVEPKFDFKGLPPLLRELAIAPEFRAFMALGPQGIRALATHPTLEKIELHQDQEVDRWAKAGEGFAKLERLALFECRVNKADLGRIAELPTLRELSFAKCSLQRKGHRPIALAGRNLPERLKAFARVS